MPDGLYERDALAWAEQQADLLRRLASGERVNDAVDWANVIEEVGDVGLSELRACESLLTQAMVHLLGLHLQPEAQAIHHWRGEVATFLATARRRFTPSMRRRILPDELYADAMRRVRAEWTGPLPIAAPDACPFALDELLDPRSEITDLIARLRP